VLHGETLTISWRTSRSPTPTHPPISRTRHPERRAIHAGAGSSLTARHDPALCARWQQASP